MHLKDARNINEDLRTGTITNREWERIERGREYCRVDDDPSYDYSDYVEQRGYYKPHDNDEDYDEEVGQDD